MREEQLREMQVNIDKLIKKNKLKDKYIVIFGSNQPAEDIIEYLEKCNIQVNALIDNNKNKTGCILRNIKIYSPAELLEEFKDDAVVLIASKYYVEMRSELNNMGYKENKHIYKVVELNRYSDSSLSLGTFYDRCKKVYEGYKVWNRLTDEFGEEAYIHICAVVITGDVYIASAFIEEYNKVNNIKDYVITTIGNACTSVAQMFHMKNVVKLTQNESDNLVQYYLLIGKENTNIKVFNHRYPYTNRIGELGNYKGVNFADHFKYSICNLKEDSLPKKPSNRGDIKYVKRIFEENGLIYKKTVILSPYANTASILSDEYWMKLTKELKDSGYMVCTNSANNSEPAIEGTIALRFPLNEAIAVVEYAGYFIGLRSGFCDVIASADCRKVILYTDRVYQSGKLIDFFGVRDMGLSDDVEEIVWVDELSIDYIITKVIKANKKGLI